MTSGRGDPIYLLLLQLFEFYVLGNFSEEEKVIIKCIISISLKRISKGDHLVSVAG